MTSTTSSDAMPDAPRDLTASDNGATIDAGFRWLARSAAVTILVVLGLIAWASVNRAWPAFVQEGFGFVTSSRWAPSADSFGALTMVYGTVVVSTIALVSAVPVSIGIALFTAEVAPRRLQ